MESNNGSGFKVHPQFNELLQEAMARQDYEKQISSSSSFRKVYDLTVYENDDGKWDCQVNVTGCYNEEEAVNEAGRFLKRLQQMLNQ